MVGAGQATCLTNATVPGSVVVQPGGSLFLSNATIGGSISASGANAITICGSTVNGSISISNTSGFVLLGNGGCAPNTFRGNLSLNSNHGGFKVSGNQITSTLSASSNTVSPGALNPSGGPANQIIKGNTIGGVLNCSGNVPPPTNEGTSNAVTGPRVNQCSAPGF